MRTGLAGLELKKKAAGDGSLFIGSNSTRFISL